MPNHEYQKAPPSGGADVFTSIEGIGKQPPPFQLTASPVTPPGGSDDGFPWFGMVKEDAWSSGFYTAPDKSSKTVDFPLQMPITAPDGIAERPFLPPLVNPFPEFEPAPTTVWDWAYWEEVTGLTGAALVIYLIVSEGSRLFPPRNLVPIP